jgi:DNA-binding transcriptional MocR family regulator
MTDFNRLSVEELKHIESKLNQQYSQFQSRNITLDMTRGKPCPEQLDLCLAMLDCVNNDNIKSQDGTDLRNYGGLDGIPTAKKLFAQYLEVEPDEIIIGGNSSLNMMHDTFMRAMLKGVAEDVQPWAKLPEVKFLCPSPGYDRHFFICDYLGIQMIPIAMDANGPDMDAVEHLVATDGSIKGIWCVPKYSNPTGIVYSDEVVERLAAMHTKAADFRIFWDNAYAVHFLNDSPAGLKNILSACKRTGDPDRVYMFGSTSKISFSGSGIAMMAGSTRNMEYIKKQISFQTIGPDKINQLRHVRFFKNMAGIENHMKQHAAILKPKFDAVDTILEKELRHKNIAQWSKPDGGYFVSLDTMDGCATTVIQLASDAGVKLTPAGSTFPYKKDPRDRNIRLAPSFPQEKDIRQAMALVTICIQLVSIAKIIEG